MIFPTKEKGIVSLVAVLAIGVLALSLSFLAADGAIGEVGKNRNKKYGDRTLISAESDMREGAYQYLKATSTYSAGTTTLPSVILNDTSAATTTVSVDWPYVRVRSSAENERTSHLTAMKITVFPEGGVFDFAIYSNGDISLSGSSHVVGNVSANGDAEMDGSSSVEGNVSVGGNIDPDDYDHANGTITLGTVVPPPAIDVAPYKTDAQNDGTHFILASGNGSADRYLSNEDRESVTVFSSTTASVDISGSNTRLYDGTLVCLGDLKLNGGEFTAASGSPALIVLGDLDLAGGVVINGLVFVSGSTVSGTGGATINGSLLSLSGGPLSISGNIEINYVPSDWEDLSGLSHVSSAPPKILGWSDE